MAGAGGSFHAAPGRLHVSGDSMVHRLAPEAKVAGVVLFAIAVALTPRRAVVVFAVDAVALATVVTIAGLSLRMMLTRLLVVAPFVTFALFLPFLGGGETVTVAGVALSSEGLWGTWNVMAKATLGATASIVLSATTPIPDVLRGLTRLGVPVVLVSIIAFMFRYLDVVADQLRRMRQAMTARGHDPRWLWQARPIASAAGSLFVRSYERGERIHHAMMARGFAGAMPELDHRRAQGRDWLVGMAPAILALVAVTLWWAR